MPQVLAPQQQSIHNRTALSRLVFLVATLSILLSICASFVGFHHSIFDFHGFRQAQTAISAEYMEHGGPFFRYQTPVLGPPWSIPFEFPLYQKIVALLVEHLHVPLDETGRAVSIAFFYLCFLPLASILRHLRCTRIQILAILSLFAVSPIYIFVSRLFMIESAALFFSLMYVDMIFRLATGDRPWQFRYMLLAALFGSLAGLVKVTTFATFLILGSAVGLSQLWKSYRDRTLSLSRIAAVVLLSGLLPVSLTIWWTKFAEAVRAQNPFCAFFLANLNSWNFGTLAERMDLANYPRFIHAVAGQAGSLPLLLLLVLVYAAVLQRWNIAALVSLALYIIAPMMFFRLHRIHEYYPYSSAIFLVVAAGLLIADLLNLPGRRSWLGFAFLVALVAVCLVRYHSGFFMLQQSNAPGNPELAAIIDRTTNPDDVIVTTGLGWSSELPYQSHRRTIMDFSGAFASYGHPLDPLLAAVHNQGAQSIPEVLVCDDSRGTDRAQTILKVIGLPDSTTLHTNHCDIYLRPTR